MSSPRSVGDEEAEEAVEEDEEEDEEQGSGEVVGHWELWLGTADCELWEGTWAALEQLEVEPMPFSVRNSSRSMYCSWKRPPSAGRVRSHMSGPRKPELEKLPFPLLLLLSLPPLLLLLLPLPLPPLLLRMEQRPRDSSSRSRVRSLSGEKIREDHFSC